MSAVRIGLLLAALIVGLPVHGQVSMLARALAGGGAASIAVESRLASQLLGSSRTLLNSASAFETGVGLASASALSRNYYGGWDRNPQSFDDGIYGGSRISEREIVEFIRSGAGGNNPLLKGGALLGNETEQERLEELVRRIMSSSDARRSRPTPASLQEWSLLDTAIAPKVTSAQPKRERLNFEDVMSDPASTLMGFSGILVVGDYSHMRHARKLLQMHASDGAFAVLRVSTNPEVGIAQLSEKASDLTIAHDIPSEEGAIAGIHRLNGANLYVDRFHNYRTQAQFDAGPGVRNIDLAENSPSETVEDRVRKMVTFQVRNSLLIVIGHIDAGRVRFHDGTSLNINELDGAGTTWVIGCSTFRFLEHQEGLGLSTIRGVSYLEAIELAKRAIAGFRADQTMKDLLLQMERSKLESRSELRNDRARSLLKDGRRLLSPAKSEASAIVTLVWVETPEATMLVIVSLT